MRRRVAIRHPIHPARSRLAGSGATLLLAAAASGVTVVDPGQGPVALAPGTPNAHELSGLAAAGGEAFLAVSDSGKTVYTLDVAVDLAAGTIDAASVQSAQPLAVGTDLEGLVRLPGGSWLVSDEVGPAIREHDPADGSLLSDLGVPPIYSQARANFSLESLAWRPASGSGDGALWTANEEALSVDGPLSTGSAGSRVRLQRYDANFVPDGQWAYLTDPYPGGPFLNAERSGVSDLLALSSGELLVLERSFSDQGFRTRIYEVDFAGATDTTGLSSLANDPHTPVGKILRFELAGGFSGNYEGWALGPLLDGGDQSLLLVSDDGGNSGAQFLYALRIHYAPEPGSLSGLASGLAALGLLGARAPSRELSPRQPVHRTARPAAAAGARAPRR